MATTVINPDRIVIAVPGTSEIGPHSDPSVEIGMLSYVTRHLTTELWEKYYLPYDALYGNGMSYRDSRDRAVGVLVTKLLNYQGSEIYLLGYSQGAAVVTLAVKRLQADKWNDGPEYAEMVQKTLDKIRGIYLVANPHRQPGMIYGPDPGGEGISFSPEDGWWGELKERVMEICAPLDIIGSADPETTFLKRLPLYTIDMNWANTVWWAHSMYQVLTSSNPLTLYPELRKQLGIFTYLTRYWNTARALKNYVATNVHVNYTKYNVYGGNCLRAIANSIIERSVL